MPITYKSRTYIIQRLHFLSRAVWFYKFAVSCIVLVLASSLEYGANAVDESGVKAAFFALCAACILLVDLLPSAHGRYGIFATIITRASGALLAFGAGWYWISSETNEAPLSFILPYVLLLAIMVLPMMMGTIFSTLTFQPRQARRESFPPIVEDALAKEYQRLGEALADENTRDAEIAGCVLAAEVHISNLLVFLYSDPKSGFTRDNLDNLLRYADTDPSEAPTAIAATSLHRRLRLLVQGTLGETPRDP